MSNGSQEKLIITNKDALYRRHKENYESIDNGELYNFGYEVTLRAKEMTFFEKLSDYDFLKGNADGDLTLRGLKEELKVLDDLKSGISFTKNFLDHSVKRHLNTILGVENWRKYLKKSNDVSANRDFNNDILQCLYLLAHLHKASPTYIRELSKFNCTWSSDLRVYYPRNDILLSREYGAYLAELFVNILYYQPHHVRLIIKNLDTIIDRLVEHVDTDCVQGFLGQRSEDSDIPSLKILKYCQAAYISHKAALNAYISDHIAGEFSINSSSEFEFNEKKLAKSKKIATANDYRLVAAVGVRLNMPRGHILNEELRGYHQTVYNALASDWLRGLGFESDGTKDGKKDTSIAAAIKIIAAQNSENIENIFASSVLSLENVPEIYSTYIKSRAQYALNLMDNSSLANEQLEKMKLNPKISNVLDYIFGNNICRIYQDIIYFDTYLKLTGHNGIFIYECIKLPQR